MFIFTFSIRRCLVLACLSLSLLLIGTQSRAESFDSVFLVSDSEAFLNKLKSHYESTRSIKKFSLNYHFLNKQYRSENYWDYNVPNRVLSVRMVEVDMEKKHFMTTTFCTLKVVKYWIGRSSKTILTVITTSETATIWASVITIKG